MKKLNKLAVALMTLLILSGCTQQIKPTKYTEINQDYLEQNQATLFNGDYVLLICDSTDSLCISSMDTLQATSNHSKYFLDVYPYLFNINRENNDDGMTQKALENYRFLLAKHQLTNLPTLFVFDDGVLLDKFEVKLNDEFYKGEDQTENRKTNYINEAMVSFKEYIVGIKLK